MDNFQIRDIFVTLQITDETGTINDREIKLVDIADISFMMGLHTEQVGTLDTCMQSIKKVEEFHTVLQPLKVPHNKIFWCDDSDFVNFDHIVRECVTNGYDMIVFYGDIDL